MRSLPIITPHYQQLEKQYEQWLKTLGYSKSTITNYPSCIRELFHYLEHLSAGRHGGGITTLQAITADHITAFFLHRKTRKNHRYGGGVSSSHINNGRLALHKFVRFLKVTGQHTIEIDLGPVSVKNNPRVILTKAEIRMLYEATYHHHRQGHGAMGQRDRAILAIFYGCGLRSNEGVQLDVSDILTDKHLVYVHKGKANKERYVPIATTNMQDIKEYLQYGRKWFLNDHSKSHTDHHALFISTKRIRIRQGGLFCRVRRMAQEAGIGKPVGLHTFRHSIATHLLQNGMDIEQIARFLGHSTLESTQIYTHIVNELQQ